MVVVGEEETEEKEGGREEAVVGLVGGGGEGTARRLVRSTSVRSRSPITTNPFLPLPPSFWLAVTSSPLVCSREVRGPPSNDGRPTSEDEGDEEGAGREEK